MTTMPTIEVVWARLAEGTRRPVHLASAIDYPIELFGQLDSRSRPGLLALSDRPPPKPPSYSAFDIGVGQRADSRWAISLSLAQESLASQFAAMCDKVLQLGATCPPGADAGAFLLQQVARWHRMLALGPDGLMTAEAQRGLLGELVVLRASFDRFGAEVSVLGWVGPDDAPQDFLLPELPVEVKTVLAGVQTVNISSLEQLDISDGSLALAVVEVVQCANGTGGTTLSAAVRSHRGLLADNVHARERFEEQLSKAGYTDRDEYDEIEYRVVRTRWFGVSDEFPRLVRSAVPLPVTNAKYQLLLSALATHEINPFHDHG